MIGAHAGIIGPRLPEDARRELVAGQHLHFVRLGDRVLAFGVLLQLALANPAVDPKDADIGRNVVAVRQFHLGKTSLGRAPSNSKRYQWSPAGADTISFREVPCTGRYSNSSLAAVTTSPRATGVASLPRMVGSRGTRPAIDLQMVSSRRRTLRRHPQFGATRGTKEAVQIRIAGMQRLTEQHAAAFHDRYADACPRTQTNWRIGAEEQAVTCCRRKLFELRHPGRERSCGGINGRQGEVRSVRHTGRRRH